MIQSQYYEQFQNLNEIAIFNILNVILMYMFNDELVSKRRDECDKNSL